MAFLWQTTSRRARDLPGRERHKIAAAVGRPIAAGFPVVTLVSDLPHSARPAYIGIDKRAAGATAAYLLGQWLGGRPGNVLTTVSRGSFRGEEEREMGFRSAMRLAEPRRSLVEVTDSDGLDATQHDLVLEALKRDEDIIAVYSVGGGNLATLDALEALGRECAVFIAHDLDHDNTRLLRDPGGHAVQRATGCSDRAGCRLRPAVRLRSGSKGSERVLSPASAREGY